MELQGIILHPIVKTQETILENTVANRQEHEACAKEKDVRQRTLKLAIQKLAIQNS